MENTMPILLAYLSLLGSPDIYAFALQMTQGWSPWLVWWGVWMLPVELTARASRSGSTL